MSVASVQAAMAAPRRRPQRRLETVAGMELEVHGLTQELEELAEAKVELSSALTQETAAKEHLMRELKDSQEAQHHLEEEFHHTRHLSKKLESELEQAIEQNSQLEDLVRQLRNASEELDGTLRAEVSKRKQAEEALKLATEEVMDTTASHRASIAQAPARDRMRMALGKACLSGQAKSLQQREEELVESHRELSLEVHGLTALVEGLRSEVTSWKHRAARADEITAAATNRRDVFANEMESNLAEMMQVRGKAEEIAEELDAERLQNSRLEAAENLNVAKDRSLSFGIGSLALDLSPNSYEMDELNERLGELIDECHAFNVITEQGREEMASLREELSEEKALVSGLQDISTVRHGSLDEKVPNWDDILALQDMLMLPGSSPDDVLEILETAFTAWREVSLQRRVATEATDRRSEEICSLSVELSEQQAYCAELQLGQRELAEHADAVVHSLEQKLAESQEQLYAQEQLGDLAVTLRRAEVESHYQSTLRVTTLEQQVAESSYVEHQFAELETRCELAERASLSLGVVEQRLAESEARLGVAERLSLYALTLEQQLADSDARCELAEKSGASSLILEQQLAESEIQCDLSEKSKLAEKSSLTLLIVEQRLAEATMRCELTEQLDLSLLTLEQRLADSEARCELAENSTVSFLTCEQQLAEAQARCKLAEKSGLSVLVLEQRLAESEARCELAEKSGLSVLLLEQRLAESETRCELAERTGLSLLTLGTRLAESEARCELAERSNLSLRALEQRLEEAQTECQDLRQLEAQHVTVLERALGGTRLEDAKDGVELLCEALGTLSEQLAGRDGVCKQLQEKLKESTLLVDTQSGELGTLQEQFLNLETQCMSAQTSASEIEKASLQLDERREEVTLALRAQIKVELPPVGLGNEVDHLRQQLQECQKWQLSTAELIGAQHKELNLLRQELSQQEHLHNAAKLASTAATLGEEEAVAVAVSHLQDRETAEEQRYTEYHAAAGWRKEVDAFSFQTSYLEAECEELSNVAQNYEAAMFAKEQLAVERGQQLERLQWELDILETGTSHDLVELREQLADRGSELSAARLKCEELDGMRLSSTEASRHLHASRAGSMALQAELSTCLAEHRALGVVSTERAEELGCVSRSSVEAKAQLRATQQQSAALQAQLASSTAERQLLQGKLQEVTRWGREEMAAMHVEASAVADAHDEAAAAAAQVQQLQKNLAVREAQLQRIQGLMTKVRRSSSPNGARCELGFGEALLGSPFNETVVGHNEVAGAAAEQKQLALTHHRSHVAFHIPQQDDSPPGVSFTPRPIRYRSTPNLRDL